MIPAAVIVRLLGPGDAALLATPADDVFDHPVDPALAQVFLDDPRHHIAVAIADGQIVGFASGINYIHPDKPAQMFINECGVAPRWQRQGIGRAALDALLTHAHYLGCTEAWVLTETDNGPARGLYLAAGANEQPGPCYFVFNTPA